MRAHRVHYQPKTVVVWSLDGQRVKGEPSTGVTPLRSIRPCQPHGRIEGEVGGGTGLHFGFITKVPLNLVTKHHPLVVDNIGELGETSSRLWKIGWSTKPSL